MNSTGSPINSPSSSFASFQVQKAPSESSPSAKIAKNQFARQQEVSLDVSTYHIFTYLKELPFGLIKIKNVVVDFFKGLGNSRVIVTTGTQVLCLIRRLLLFIPSNQDDIVNKFSGSLHLSKALYALSESLAPIIESAFHSPEWHQIFKSFLTQEHDTYKKLLDVLLPNIYINIARNITEDYKKSDGLTTHKIGLTELVAYLSKIIQSHLPDIHSQIEQIEKISDPIRKEKKIRRLFSPLSNAVLLTVFTKGQKEFPIRYIPIVSRTIWSKIQHELPSLFYWIYKQLMSPFKEDKKLILLKMRGGDSLVSLAELAGQTAGEKIPTLFFPETTGEQPEVVNSIVKGFSSFIKGSDALKTWLGSWLEDQFNQLGKSEDSDIIEIWKLLGKYVEPLLIHVFYHLSETSAATEKIQGKLPDALGVCFIKLFTVFSNFFNRNGKSIEERIAVLKKKNKNPETDEILYIYFKKLTNALLSIIQLEKHDKIPLPDFLKKIVFDNLNLFIPRFFMKQYLLMTTMNSSNDDVGNTLRKQFFDPGYLKDPLLAMSVLSTLHEKGESYASSFFELFNQEIWKLSGTEMTVQTIEGICSVLSFNVMAGLMSFFGISSQQILKEEQNVFMKMSNQYIKSFVDRLILNLFKNLIELTNEIVIENGEQHPKKFVPFNIIHRVIEMLQSGLKNVDESVQNLLKTHPVRSPAYDQEIRQIFNQLATSIHDLFGKDAIKHMTLDALPDHENIKLLLWESVKDVLLPDLLFTFYSETVVWQQQFKQSSQDLEHYYQTSHPGWACHLAAQYGSDYIKHYLANCSRDAAQILFNALLSYFGDSLDVKSQTTKDLLLEQELLIRDLLSQNLRLIAESEEPSMLQFWPALTYYIETALAKFLAEISKSIHEIEQANPDLMVDTAISLLREMANHFKLINEITAYVGTESTYLINQKTVLTAFGKTLHDGVPLDPSLKPEEKERIRIEGFFYPLAVKLFKLANITIKDLPLPSLFRNEMGELLLQKLLPLALLKANQQALEHHVRDSLMLSFVHTLYEALTKIEFQSKIDIPEETKIEIDSKQKHLNETCGELVLELVKLIPDTMMQYVFMKEQVKNMSAETIGKSIMPYLSKSTFLQVIDYIIYNGLLSFHPSRWEGKIGKEILVPRKAFVRPDGKQELKVVKKFKFTFPKTVEQFLAEAYLKLQEAKLTRKQLRNGFTRTISSQLQLKAWSVFKSLWLNFQTVLDNFIERQFQNKGLKIKKNFDYFFRKIFFELFGTAFIFLMSPLIKLIGWTIEKIYIDARSDDIIENLHADTLENLFYRFFETVMDTLTKQYVPRTPLPE
jgi:hypothetical protein